MFEAFNTCDAPAKASAQSMCDVSQARIDPDYRYSEDDFTADEAEKAIAALRGPFADWVRRSAGNGLGADLHSGELGMAYTNNLNGLTGYVLRQKALAEQSAGAPGPATQAFCDFLLTTPIID